MNYRALETIRTIMNIHHAHKDCKIFFHNGPCATDGTNLWLNAGQPDDEVWASLIEAKVTHEIGGHQKHTNFSTDVMNFLKKATPLEKALSNIIEDCFIESEVIREYGGTYHTFLEMTENLFKEGYFVSAKRDHADPSLLQAFLLYTGRGKAIAGQLWLIDEGHRAKQLLVENGYPESVLDEVEERMETWGDLGSTENNIAETLRVIEILNQLADEDEQSDEQSQDKSPSGETGDQQSESNGTGDDSQNQDQNNDQGEDDASASSDDDSNQSSTCKKGLSKDELHQMGQDFTDLHDVMNEAIDAQASEDVSDETLKQYNKPGASQSEINRHMDYVWHSVIDSESEALARPVAAQIESAMWSKEMVSRNYDDSGSDFDADLLAGVVAGNNNIFYQENEVETSKSAILLLVDRSGSMGFDDMHTANVASVAIAKALESLNIPYSLCYFDTVFEVHSAFENRITEMSFSVDSRGGTDTGSALEKASFEFEKLTEDIPRKQILVITDMECDERDVEAASYYLNRLNIDVASIQLDCGKDKGLENFVVLNDIEQLPDLMFDIVKNRLLESISI
ncbi:hypothetical protein L0B53_19235 (plasmid) [Vibrio sp. SS-MA-C1-2]|uniref:vWA domain-containing protein n=1 Tax=Vibrio sp. SS-MA-C1-2 TaxID=2908646 RepID=UPI001F318BD8|nr:vWA domain-containing protein [Vibrio sp. SS-MA-C1-2]UJF20269.1 hypothetical protein L0B53_19235 [Vibrio sp. SS-MA-C1-2]